MARETLKESEKVAKSGGLFLPPASSRPSFSTGCSLIDRQIGRGYAEEQIILLRGDTGSGKSLMAAEAAANFLVKHENGEVLYRDREDACDEAYLETLGIDPKSIDIKRDLITVEAVMADVIAKLQGQIKLGAKSKPMLYCIDSWDALSSEAEMKRKAGDKTYGMEKAKGGQEFGRKVSGLMQHKYARFTLLVVAQIRLGTTPDGGVSRKTSGGSWLKFYPTQVLDLKTKLKLKGSSGGHERTFGQWVEVVPVKNRRAAPAVAIMVPIRFSFGIDDLMACVRFLADEGRADLMFDPTDKDASDSEKAKSVKTKASTFCTGVRRLNAEQYQKHLETARTHALKLFSDVEKMFKPKHSKYGG